jgi:HK97 family phage major capsid protein
MPEAATVERTENPLITTLRDKRDAKQKDIDDLTSKLVSENRSFVGDEEATFKAQAEEIRALDDRINELVDLDKRERDAAEARRSAGDTGEQRASVTEPDMYAKGGPNSYFRDLHAAQRGSRDAVERLNRNTQHQAETRAVGNTNGAGGSGGEWAPPTWVIDEWVNLIRPGRITANLFAHEDVPVGTSSINYPKLLTGTSVALQSTQNTALSSTDPTTGYVQTGFSTLGGKNVASQQILDQARNFDQVITSDLAAAYATQVGTQIFTGTGTGSGTNSVINGLGAATIGSTQTWTQATPTGAGFYGQTGALLTKFLAARLMPPTHWIMHPRRWYWLESMADSNGRPYVVPNGNAYNPIAVENGVVAMGEVGTFHGLPVVIDPLVPTNLGGGTNQDIVYLIKADDLVLFESSPQSEVFRDTYADSLGVLFRLYAYVATILNRHPESIGALTGTGLTTPTFAS